MTPPLSKRIGAELLGTFWLVFGGCGSAIFAAKYFAAGGALDANGNGAYVAEKAVQRWGERIQGLKATAEWYRGQGWL